MRLIIQDLNPFIDRVVKRKKISITYSEKGNLLMYHI